MNLKELFLFGIMLVKALIYREKLQIVVELYRFVNFRRQLGFRHHLCGSIENSTMGRVALVDNNIC